MLPVARPQIRSLPWSTYLRVLGGLVLVTAGVLRFVGAVASIEADVFLLIGVLEVFVGALLLFDSTGQRS